MSSKHSESSSPEQSIAWQLLGDHNNSKPGITGASDRSLVFDITSALQRERCKKLNAILADDELSYHYPGEGD